MSFEVELSEARAFLADAQTPPRWPSMRLPLTEPWPQGWELAWEGEKCKVVVKEPSLTTNIPLLDRFAPPSLFDEKTIFFDPAEFSRDYLVGIEGCSENEAWFVGETGLRFLFYCLSIPRYSPYLQGSLLPRTVTRAEIRLTRFKLEDLDPHGKATWLIVPHKEENK